MEANQSYLTAFTRYENIQRNCQMDAAQWISPHDAVIPECQTTAWSLSPFVYPARSQPCMCSRCGSVQTCYCNNPNFTQDHKSRKVKRKEDQPDKATRKILKFGIERILTDDDKFTNRTEQLSSDGNSSTLIPKKERPVRSRRKNGTRSVFSHVQRNLLESYYQRREYVTKGERYHIALEVGISEEQVKIWFQNRRTKRKKLETSKECEKTYAGRVFYNIST